ncbi:hypothetical protein B0T14DRAFT_490474 [Immersiella caudata]|uniref:C3H1-type domain-containing protein n=1 Tax=Immersiella caudata TaxID=314043 RepID=A0AA39XDM9_9PEZI|nr:hypothetical protein B0T14DRAFT_490474 [Immersiella caudata]
MTPQPLFFLVRPGVTVQTPSGPMQTQPGSIVPLIATDELPDWIDIAGAPRELTVQQTIGLANLGSFIKAEGHYPVRIAYDSPGDDSSSDGEGVKPSWADLVEDMEGDRGDQEGAAKVASAAGPTPVVPPTPAVSPAQLNAHPAVQSQPTMHLPLRTSVKATDIHPADRMKAHWNAGQHNRTAGLSASTHNKQAISTVQPDSRTAAESPGVRSIEEDMLALSEVVLEETRERARLRANTAVKSSKPTPLVYQATTPSTAASPQPTPQSVDEYCRHWCHYGTCKWGLQCRYKHSMPTTPSGLLEVGLSEFPTWWLAKVFVGDAPSLSAASQNHPTTHANVDINLAAAAAAAALGLGGLGGLTPYPSQANAQNLGLNQARDYYARQLGVMRGMGLGLGAQGGGIGGLSNKKLKTQLRDAVGLLRELGLTMALSSVKRKERKPKDVSPLDRGGKMKVAVAMEGSGDVRVQQQQKGDGHVQGQGLGHAQGAQQAQADAQANIIASEATGSVLQAQQQQQQAQTPITQAVHGVSDATDAKTGSQISKQGVVVVLPPPHPAVPSAAATQSQSQELVDV